MSCEPCNILEPIDPLNISFSQDKCVRTPQTYQTKREISSSCSKVIVKSPQSLFSSRERLPHFPRTNTPKIARFQTVYKPICRFPQIQQKNWNQRFSSKKIMKPLNIGLFNQGFHLKQIDKLDYLIHRVNKRIQVSRRLVRS